MSLFDAILGRSRPIKASIDQMFALSTAELTMETEFGLSPQGGAAICFKPVSSGDFARMEADINDLLKASSSSDAPLQSHTFRDTYGYQWIILQTPDFSNLVATVHMINRELQDHGYSEQLLASVFQFADTNGRHVYWIYNYKRATFYPFVPGPNQSRDNALELRLSSIMERELPVERDLTKWYALWGIPL